MFQFVSSRSILKHSKRLAGATFIASFTTATYHRPVLDRSNENDQNSIIAGPKRSQEFFCSEQLPLFSRENTPTFISVAQHISIGATALAIRILMNTYGEYNIVNDDNYNHFINLVLGGDGRSEKNQGIITVSNHRSLFDDPGVVSCLLPLHMAIQPKYNRWGICSQEFCFSDILPSFIKGYIGAGQVLPIRRGGGIDQKLFKDFASLLAVGEWVHIFPEGGVWQRDELGGRGRGHTLESMKVDKSKLKWGVGKLIAHAPTRPRLIPFAHVGMDNLLPQHPENGKTGLKKKLFGGDPLKVHVRFGEEIIFDDLIEDYEKKHGSLWKYENQSEGSKWVSSESEKLLYRQITLRIEKHLEPLTEQVVCRDFSGLKDAS